MTPNSEEFKRFLRSLSGSDADPPLMVRDPGSALGWRPWTEGDSDALLDWFSDPSEGDSLRRSCECFNQKELARYLGVSVPKVTEWLRREDNPIPHLKDGRLILVPAFLLMEWLREESERREDAPRGELLPGSS